MPRILVFACLFFLGCLSFPAADAQSDEDIAAYVARAETAYQIGNALRRTSDHALKVRVLTAAIESNRFDGVGLGYLYEDRGAARFAMERYSAAADDFETAIPLLELSALDRHPLAPRLIRALVLAGRFNDAAYATDHWRASRGAPSRFQRYDARYEIEAYLGAGRFDDALRAWRELLASDDESPARFNDVLWGFGERLDYLPTRESREEWIELTRIAVADAPSSNRLFHRLMIRHLTQGNNINEATVWANALVDLELERTGGSRGDGNVAIGGFRSGGPTSSQLGLRLEGEDRETIQGSCAVLYDVNHSGWVENVRIESCDYDVLAEAVEYHTRDQEFAPLVVNGRVEPQSDLRAVYHWPLTPE
ncbi:MAG: hypothetical protein GYB36_07735 [Alphaproteobacteria bacterium]|nr:hypothetical protein [Alphaproteobacteria bacterium]